MLKKDISELKRRLKKDNCTFTKVCGCYVDSDKKKVTNIDEIFLNLDDSEYFKYLEIAKKVVSGKLKNNLLELSFDKSSGQQQSLLKFKKSALKDSAMLDNFYNQIINNYKTFGNYLILIFHDVYDVMTKTSDGQKLDESEEIYEYILCAICPVTLSNPGLGYRHDENIISTLKRDWVVGMPETGFLYPAFTERSTDIDHVLFYTKDTKEPHTELMTDILGCEVKTTTEQKQNDFVTILDDAMETASLEEDIMKVTKGNILEDLLIKEIDFPEDRVTTDKIEDVLFTSGLTESVISSILEEYNKRFTKEEIPEVTELVKSKELQKCKPYANRKFKRIEKLIMDKTGVSKENACTIAREVINVSQS